MVQVTVPLLFCPVRSPALDPGHVPAERLAQIDCGFVDRLDVYGSPKFELVSLAVALVAVVSTFGEIDRKRPAGRRTSMDGTRTVQLLAMPTGRFPSQPLEHLAHRDLASQPIEIDSWHDRAFSLKQRGGTGTSRLRTRAVRPNIPLAGITENSPALRWDSPLCVSASLPSHERNWLRQMRTSIAATSPLMVAALCQIDTSVRPRPLIF